ncbi:CAP domain-containing protein [Thalassotalea sp. Y01]|uniref:CAP domain-containing protein n=1 Tax=Thalassotalea sp. Y01 TaxID=2729613 RepID=UPI00145C3E91|nr:CAP domain-containing protein [Thalassotalea sp. Y01]NMP17391.1 CAP domain-containing protein [Thalassotalea sp. Y01]
MKLLFITTTLVVILSLTTLAFAQNNPADFSACGNSAVAKQLAKYIIEDNQQRRAAIHCNAQLSELAEQKAKLMLEFGLVTHNLDGSPNARLRDGGYPLPDYYGDDFNSNQVEAIAGGYASAKDVWQAFKSSKDHRTHLLGEHEFYLEQNEIGVAFIKEWSSPHVEYWVVYLTKSANRADRQVDTSKDMPNKSDFILLNNK